MGKRGRWKVAGFDGAGEAILMRSGPRVERERPVREDMPHSVALRRMMVRDEQREQDREVRLALGLLVR